MYTGRAYINDMELKLKNTAPVFNIHEGRVPYLSFKSLDEAGVINAFSTRLGGVSEGCYSSMNFSYTGGDSREKVRENYERFAEAIGVDIERMVTSRQTHTTNIRKITLEDAGKGVTRERDYDDIDGLVTDVKGITLVTFYADCIPLYFYSPERECIGLSHSGWKGTVARMGAVTAERLRSEFGADPSGLLCCIGPGICGDCFETGAEVAEAFLKEFPKADTGRLIKKISPRVSPEDLYNRDISELEKTGIEGLKDIRADRKYYIDLWYANYLVLTEAGVRPENISVTNVCTRCNNKLLYSHRICGAKRGNLAAMLCMKEE